MGIKLLLPLLSLFFTFHAYGEIKITQISGYSRCEGKLCGDETQNSTEIFGGTAGPDCTGTTVEQTCNSCASAGDGEACNTSKIYPNLVVAITFSSDTTFGVPLISTNVNDGQQLLDVSVSSAGPFDDYNQNIATTAINQPITLYVKWSDLCDKVLGSDSNCGSSQSTKNIRIGFDTDDDDETLSTSESSTQIKVTLAVGTSGASEAFLCKSSGGSTSADGACNFIAYPGDKKVFIEDIRVPTSFPNLEGSSIDYRAIRIFYSTDDIPDTTTAQFKDFDVSSVGTSGRFRIAGVGESSIEGLDNEQLYYFRAASIDQAGNLTQFTEHDDNLGSNSNADCYDTDAEDAWPQNCHQATPSEVIGLLEKEFDCFITTATYGTPFKPKVKVFRQFRNQFLNTNALGRTIIKTYYAVSPPISKWIRNHPNVKPAVRILLWPLWAIAQLFISGLGFLFLLVPFAFTYYKRSSARRVS